MNPRINNKKHTKNLKNITEHILWNKYTEKIYNIKIIIIEKVVIM